jgi:NADH-quinone oxidoreductase subunit C
MPISPARQSSTLDLLKKTLGIDSLRTDEFRDNLRLYVDKAVVYTALDTLKASGFNLLSDLGATDYLKYPGRPASPRFEVHYVLLDVSTGDRVVIKTGLDDPSPSLPSAFPLWQGADWMEREIFDMYGIRFDGHPDLRRILMPDEFTSYPLRKDYPLRGRGERHNFPRITREQS